jgi:hypothetical protein
MAAFQPKGSRAIRVIVAELAAQKSRGDLITFAEIGRAIGLDGDDSPEARSQVRQAVSGARPLMLRDHSIALVAERGKGYRVARAGEFAGIAQDYRRRSDRAISTALANIEHAPVADMSPDERKRHQAVGIVIRNLHNRMSSAEQRLADLEAVVYGPSRKVIKGEVEPEVPTKAE